MIRSTTASYRADTLRSGEDLGPADDAWIMVGTLLEHATFSRGARRAELVRDAIDIAEATAGKDELARRVTEDWGEQERGSYEVILVLADQAERVGALNVARAVIDSLLSAVDALTPLQRGRIVARRARVDAKLGDIDAAVDQYRDVMRAGKRIASAELQAHALIGLAAIAQMRGNYPELGRLARRAARIAAKEGLRSVSRFAHNGAMIAAGARHDFAVALKHAAAIVAASNGDLTGDVETLQNIAQLLLEAGHAGAAAAAFACLASLPLRAQILLPTLGGLALASSRLGVTEQTRWAAQEVNRLRRANVPRFSLASALLECAEALTIIGDSRRAENTLKIAVALAERHGFHEIVIKAEQLRRNRPEESAYRSPIGRSGARLAQQLIELRPASLPDRAILVAGGSR